MKYTKKTMSSQPMMSLKLSLATASIAIAQKGWIMSVIMSDQAKVTTVAAHTEPQLFCRRNHVRSNDSPLASSGGDEVIEKPSVPVHDQRKGLLGSDGDKSLRECNGKVSIPKQPEDTCIEGELNNNPPYRFPRSLGGLQERPGSPVEEDAEHEHSKIHDVEGELYPFRREVVNEPDQSTDENKEVKPRPPVHPVRRTCPLRRFWRRFIECELTHEFRFHDKGFLWSRVHQGHQHGDNHQNHDRENDVEWAEDCLRNRDHRVQ